MISYTEIG